ncbi:MAG: Na+-driven multidrug efflux pump [Colwellia sp.]|jgi:Na+-driven multidrug efflux pump
MVHCKQHWMLNTPIFRLILSCSLPILPAVFLLSAYDLFETGLIARLCSTHLAALSFSAPITTAMTGVAIALSIATNSWICRIKSTVNHNSCITEKNELKSNVARALVLATTLTFILALLMYFISPTLYVLLGTQSSVQPAIELGMTSLVTSYTDIRLIGWIPLILVWQINGILRSFGHIKQASILLVTWMITKSVLSYSLIGDGQCSQLLETGIIGAGYAHLISDSLFAVVSLGILIRGLGIEKHQILAMQWTSTLKQMSVTGINASLQQLYLPITIGILTFYIASIAEDKVALLSIIFRIETLGLFIPMVFTASLPGLIAANWWAGKIDRVKALIIQGVIIITMTQVLLACVLYFYAETIAAEISQNTNLHHYIEHYLIYVPISFIGAGCTMLAISSLNAIGKSANASILGFGHKVILILIFSIIGGWIASITGVFIGIALAHIVSLFLVSKLFIRKVWRKDEHKADLPYDFCELRNGD